MYQSRINKKNEEYSNTWRLSNINDRWVTEKIKRKTKTSRNKW